MNDESGVVRASATGNSRIDATPTGALPDPGLKASELHRLAHAYARAGIREREALGAATEAAAPARDAAIKRKEWMKALKERDKALDAYQEALEASAEEPESCWPGGGE